uniref:Cilia- and flagella-associated protein 69 ARM repeats domain-containing protein n=1 Tax=Kryptolebias marmoratus TaxID=37003 RepID=A0A3Q2ZBL4_KRYMA
RILNLCAEKATDHPEYASHSDIPKTLLLSMAAVQNQPAVKLQLLQTLQILSSSSGEEQMELLTCSIRKLNSHFVFINNHMYWIHFVTTDRSCASMLRARGAEMICLHMNEPDPSGQVLFCSAEILWNLVEGGSREEAVAQLSSMECVLSLKEAFFFLVENASQPSDLRLRNYLLVITCFIAENPNALLVVSTGRSELLCFVTFPECKTRLSLQKTLTYNNEDVKMKKLLLNLLVLLCRDVAALQLCREEQVMMFLLKLVTSERQPGPPCWSAAQQEQLQLQALAVLGSVAPLMLEDFVSCQGNNRLLLLLDCCVGSGQSRGGGAGGCKEAQMRGCIRALRSVTSLGDPSVNQDLCDQGAISHLLGNVTRSEPSDEEDALSVEMMSDIQLILSALCETDIHNKVEQEHRKHVKGSEKFYSGLGHNRLVLSTVDCVWSCIVGCYSTEFYFSAKKGPSLLLDLLRVSSSIHLFLLCINVISCQGSWRDADGQTAPRFLLQLWREEEEELGVLRDQHGGILDPRKPLLTRFHQDAGGSSSPAAAPSAAVLEASENLRAKIYFILCSLGFLELPGLSAEDYVTLSIVKRYLDFKVGEVWAEVSAELGPDGVRPISPDQDALTSIRETSEDTARRTVVEQTNILELQQEEELSEELLVYTEVLGGEILSDLCFLFSTQMSFYS